MINFLTVICLGSCLYFYFKLRRITQILKNNNSVVDKYFDGLFKEFSKEFADLHKRDCQTQLEIRDAKKEIIEKFENEKTNLEAMRANRTKNTFKSLRTALASKGNEPDED